MIFLDANVFLRHLSPATTSAVANMKGIAGNLFDTVEMGRAIVTTSEVVIHEVCYILSSPKHYGQAAAAIAPVLSAMLQWPGFHFPAGERELYVRALDIWEMHPELEFSDSIIAARCERAGHELATFDKHFAALSFVQLWRAEASGSQP